MAYAKYEILKAIIVFPAEKDSMKTSGNPM